MPQDVRFNIRLNVNGQDVVLRASTNVKELASQLVDVQHEADRCRNVFFDWQRVMGVEALIGSIQRVQQAMASLTEESRSYEAAMRAANTMAGKDPAGFAMLKNQVHELSKEIPLARDVLANGLYQVVSNGVPEDNWIEYLRASARSAVGGIADVGEVVKVTSTIIKNYGLEWSAAQDIQDKIQLTAKNGVTSFEQLAAALPSVTGQAAQLGVSLTEMLAVMSTLTGVTGNTSEVATQLSSILTALTKESTKAQKMAAAMGIEFNAASVKAAGGLGNFLQELDKTVTAYSQRTGELKESVYAKLFGRAEALRMVNALTGQLADKFTENVAALEASAGTMDAAFEQVASTGASAMQMLKNQWAVVGDLITQYGGWAMKTVNVVATLGVMASTLGQLTRAAKSSIVAMGMLTSAQGRAALSAGKASKAIAAATASTRALGLAVRGALLATGVGAAITFLIWAFEKLTSSEKDAADAAGEFGREQSKSAQMAQEAQDTYARQQSMTFGKLMGDYTKLQQEWKNLTDTHSKMQWIHDNASAFKDLELNVTDLVSAENAFVNNTDAVRKAFELRAKFAARQAQLTKEFEIQSEQQQVRDNDRKSTTERTRSTMRAGQKVGDISDETHRDLYQKGFIEFNPRQNNWHYTKRAEDYAKSHTYQTSAGKDAQKAIEESNERVDALLDEMEADAKAAAESAKQTPTGKGKGGGKTGKGGGKTGSGGKAKEYTLTTENPTVEDLRNNVQYYTQQISKTNAADVERIATLGRLRQAEQQRLDNLEKVAKTGTTSMDFREQNKAAMEFLREPKTLEGVDNRIRAYNDSLNKGNGIVRTWAQSQIKHLNEVRKAMERSLMTPEERKRSIRDELAGKADEIKQNYEIGVIGGDEAKRKIDEINKKLKALGLKPVEVEVKVGVEAERQQKREKYDKLNARAEEIRQDVVIGIIGKDEAKKQLEEINKELEKLGLRPIKIDVSGVNDAAKTWKDAVGQMGQSLNQLGSSIKMPELNIAGTLAQAIATMTQAYSTATAQAAETTGPWGWIAFAATGLAQLSAMISSVKSLNTFADGGIVYGPTLGLFGEYAGASSNPEVVAPLDKLRSMIQPAGLPAGGVRFEIEGRKLVGVLGNETRVARVSGRRTGINV